MPNADSTENSEEPGRVLRSRLPRATFVCPSESEHPSEVVRASNPVTGLRHLFTSNNRESVRLRDKMRVFRGELHVERGEHKIEKAWACPGRSSVFHPVGQRLAIAPFRQSGCVTPRSSGCERCCYGFPNFVPAQIGGQNPAIRANQKNGRDPKNPVCFCYFIH